jgi:hypothetical protein
MNGSELGTQERTKTDASGSKGPIRMKQTGLITRRSNATVWNSFALCPPAIVSGSDLLTTMKIACATTGLTLAPSKRSSSTNKAGQLPSGRAVRFAIHNRQTFGILVADGPVYQDLTVAP